MIMHVRTSVPLLVLVASKVAHNKAVSWADITKNFDDADEFINAMHYNNAGRFYHHIAGDIYPGPIDDKSFTTRSKTEPPPPKDLLHVEHVTREAIPTGSPDQPPPPDKRSKMEIISTLNKMFANLEEDYSEDTESDESDTAEKDRVEKDKDKDAPPKHLEAQAHHSIGNVYVNLTKESGNAADVDVDGHDIHIHLPQKVIQKLARTGGDHVIHIGISDKEENPESLPPIAKVPKIAN